MRRLTQGEIMNANTESLMSKEVVTILNDESIVEAYKMMKTRDIRHLPVVNAENKIIGMLSDRDVQKAMITKKLDEYYSDVVIPSEFKVANFMNWPVYTVSEKTPLKAVAEIMIREKISSLVVEGANGNLKGIITTTDMLAYILQSDENEKSNKHWTQWTLACYLNKSK